MIVTPSQFLADYLKRNYGTPDEKIRIVPNHVDTTRFDPDNLDMAFVAGKRREWGIRDGDYVQMAIGRITPLKGLDGLIRSFAERAKSDERARLVIVGGADKRHLRHLECLKGLAASIVPDSNSPPVFFAGPQEKMPECISIADEIVSANTTKPETFGLSVAEAYAMNKPVTVLRRFGGVAEVMDAVEGAKCASTREAVMKLYGDETFAHKTSAAAELFFSQI